MLDCFNAQAGAMVSMLQCLICASNANASQSQTLESPDRRGTKIFHAGVPHIPRAISKKLHPDEQ